MYSLIQCALLKLQYTLYMLGIIHNMTLVPVLHYRHHKGDPGIELNIFYSNVASVAFPVSNQSGCQILEDKNTILTKNRDIFCVMLMMLVTLTAPASYYYKSGLKCRVSKCLCTAQYTQKIHFDLGS